MLESCESRSKLSDMKKVTPDAMRAEQQHVFMVDHLVMMATRVAGVIQQTGRVLTESEIVLARRVGVLQPESVRLLECSPSVLASDAMTHSCASKLGINLSQIMGLCLGYAVLIRPGVMSSRLLAHELRHVAQFEQFGQSLDRFMRVYFSELEAYGYADAPMEIDARAYE